MTCHKRLGPLAGLAALALLTTLVLADEPGNAPRSGRGAPGHSGAAPGPANTPGSGTGNQPLLPPGRPGSSAGSNSPGQPGPGAATGAGPLTDQSLPQILKQLGYNPKPAGPSGWLIQVEQAYNGLNWTYYILVSISGNRRYVWLVNFSVDADEKEFPPGLLVRILQSNYDTGPAYFQYIPGEGGKPGTLELTEPIANKGLDVGSLRDELNYFVTQINKTEPLWNKQKWHTGGSAVGGSQH